MKNIQRLLRLSLALVCGTLGPTAHCQTGAPSSSSLVLDNPALTNMYNVDQKAREGDHIDWPKLAKEDDQRRKDVRLLLAAGEVRTGNDYYHAAMIFQHGQNPDEYLLAHVLAMDAVAQGSNEAKWLSAATLDRYLLSIWQPQVFGTQFRGLSGSGTMTQDRINADVATDSMRNATCVVSAAVQHQVLEKVNHGGGFGSTQLQGRCK